MKSKIIIAINNSIISRETIRQFVKMPFDVNLIQVTLVHVFRKATASEQLLGNDYQKEKYQRFQEIMEQAKDGLIQHGYKPGQVDIQLVKEPYETVAEGLIDQFKKGDYDLIVLGRKRMSKAEEFVMGDPCTKLIRALDDTSIMVIKGH